MDMDKLLRWREFAQKASGKDLWSWVFDAPQSQDFLSGFSKMFAAEATLPRVDVFKNETEIIVIIEMPGLHKEDIQLAVAGDRLQIKGTVHSLYPKHTSVTSERFYGPFERTVQLPEPVSREEVSAKFINGLLEVRFLRGQQAHADAINID